jgi:hypothetical protein
VRWASLPPYQFAIETNIFNEITALFRKLQIRAREIDTLFDGPAQWSEDTRKLQREKPEEWLTVHVAYYSDDSTGRTLLCAWEDGKEHEVWKTSYWVCPIICYRPRLTAGAAWATGPGLAALPDVKVANKVVELILKNASIAVTGIWLADDDGVLNPANIRLVPGAIIPRAVGSKGLEPLGSPGRFDVAQLVLDDLRINVRRALYVTRIEEREMTAEEYRGRLQQQIREMRGMYGQLRSEFIEPCVLRNIEMAVGMGLLGGDTFDDYLQVELVGPMAQDVRGQEVERVLQTVMDGAGIFGPAAGPAMIDMPKLVPWLITQRNSERSVFKTEAELIKLAQETAKLAQQAMAAEQPAPPGQPMPPAA